MSSKEHMTELTDPAEIRELLAQRNSIDAPFTFSHRVGDRIIYRCNSQDLRAWREKRASQSQSEAEHGR